MKTNAMIAERRAAETMRPIQGTTTAVATWLPAAPPAADSFPGIRLVKAAGQVVVGETMTTGSTLIGLAMLGGAGYLGYYLGKRSKKRSRR